MASRTAALVLLSALLHAASRARAEADAASLDLCVSTLARSTALAAAADAGAMRRQLLAACSNLIQWAGPGTSRVAAQLFGVLLHLWSIDLETSEPASADLKPHGADDKGGDSTSLLTLGQLARVLGQPAPAQLCQLYAPAVLQDAIKVSRGSASGAACCSVSRPHALPCSSSAASRAVEPWPPWVAHPVLAPAPVR